ncbi:hypothetical protein BDZ97DRAFT_2071442 [Flammula alnicola]|nr:hypothetical protein BDZ97DRAFT_2071442 [Flammula alnicola]
MSSYSERQSSLSKQRKPTDIDEIRSRLDKKISEAEDPTENRRAQHARNAVSEPTSSVPPEVLCDIFAFVKAVNPSEPPPDGMFEASALDWVRITYDESNLHAFLSDIAAPAPQIHTPRMRHERR